MELTAQALDEPEEAFNIDLPTEHTVSDSIIIPKMCNLRMDFNRTFLLCLFTPQYLGNLERVSGVQWLEPNKEYQLPIFFHDSLIFPGETLPMILTQQMFLSTEFSEEGLLFGLVFHGVRNNVNLNLYGVTCQIFEKSNDGGDSISIKSRAYQRFSIKNDS